MIFLGLHLASLGNYAAIVELLISMPDIQVAPPYTSVPVHSDMNR